MTSTLPTGEDKRLYVREMFDTIAPRYDLVNKVMTFGLDVVWRRRALSLCRLAPRSLVLDVGCGTGDFLRLLRRSGHHPIGVDLSPGMLGHARSDGAPLLLADATSSPFRAAAFDGAVSGFALRNVTELETLFYEIARVLKPGGSVALLDAAEPSHRLLAAGHRLWFTQAVPRIGRLLSDRDAYAYLPSSLSYLPAGNELIEMLSRAGFCDVRRHELSGGIVQVLTGRRR